MYSGTMDEIQYKKAATGGTGRMGGTHTSGVWESVSYLRLSLTMVRWPACRRIQVHQTCRIRPPPSLLQTVSAHTARRNWYRLPYAQPADGYWK